MNSLSKSTEKALNCIRYFALSYLAQDPALAGSSELAETGTQFHAYRSAYVNHLVEVNERHDQEWATRWMGSIHLTEDAAELISRDIKTFTTDPELVFGTELFLSVDESFKPLELRPTLTPGERPRDVNSMAHGSIDLLLIDGDEAVIRDYKTGWSSTNVSDYEAAHYAALIFAHFGFINTVRFEWEFLRAAARKPTTYTRSDMSWIAPLVLAMRNRLLQVVDLYNTGGDLPINPLAGLCGFCNVTCPARELSATGISELSPLQTEDDARALAIRYRAVNAWVLKAEARLKAFLDQRGKLELGDGVIAELCVSTGFEYPLRRTLEVLGVSVPQKSPKYDVPLDGLTIGSTAIKSYGSAIKRTGLLDEVNKVAKRVPRSTLKIHKPAPELAELLQLSIEEARTSRA
jgi:hypothetical protein